MLAVRDLRVRFGPRVVSHIPELDLAAGEIVGLAGESGSGKSVAALAVCGLTQYLGARTDGRVQLGDVDLLQLRESELRRIRGRRIAMVMQNPRASLNPALRLGKLFHRTLRLHGIGNAEARRRAVTSMEEVLLDPDLLHRYPHQVSGGQAQRFSIALALALNAEFLLADEPTSALDATVQAEVVTLLRKVTADRGTGVLFISHDLAVIGELCSRLLVMRAGEVVEGGETARVLAHPSSSYTRELVAAVPRIGAYDG